MSEQRNPLEGQHHPPPARRVVASFSTYREAERAVDHLSDNRFPVERTAIVARGLRLVEQVTGRLTVWGAASRDALVGALSGALIGWLFAVFGWVTLLVAGGLLVLYGILVGAVIGGLLGALTHLATGGRRDFSAQSRFEADTYDVLADAEVSDDAARLIHTMTTDTPARPA